MLIDKDCTVLHLSNGVGRFLERPSGEPSDNLLVNVREDLRLEPRTALFKAARSKRSVKARLPQRDRDGRQCYLSIIVKPLPSEWAASALTLVVFDEVEECMRPGDGEPPDSA